MGPAMANTKRITRNKSTRTTRRPMTKKKVPECIVEITKTDIYVVYDGVRIAERGKPGTPQAKTWISLEPGFAVYNTPDFSEIVVGRTDPRIQ